MNFKIIFNRLFSVFLGGILGSISMFAIYYINLNIMDIPENLITEFFLIFMVFIGSITANIFSSAFLNFIYPEKYFYKKTIIWHIFLSNLFLFTISFPLYFLVKTDIFQLSIIHLIFSVFISKVLQETFAGKGSYTITGLYGSIFSLFLIIFIYYFFNELFQFNLTPFIILPLYWIFTEFLIITIEEIYSLIFKTTKNSFLDPKNIID
jgi:hypothetical protein